MTATSDRASGPLLPVPVARPQSAPLGVVWAVVTVAALIAGPVFIGAWFAVVGGVASAQAARTWRTHGSRPVPAAAAAACVSAVLAAAFGPIALAVGVVAGGLIVAAWTRALEGPSRSHDALLTLACAGVPAAAVVGPVLLRGHGLVPALVLVTYAFVHDASAYLIGAGSQRRWEGPLAGVASIGSVTLAVAAIFPQFKGSTPWVLGCLAAVLAPLGPAAATLVLGNRKARTPALRRLDSLVLLGPVWAIVVALLVG